MKSKQFLSGLLIGSILATSVSVFATDALVSVVKKDNTKIYVGGYELQVKEGKVLNYEGYNYTSARTIAESLGATINHQFNADGSERIDITPKPDPEPIIKEVIVEVEVEKKNDEQDKKDENKTTSGKIDYYEPPLKDNALGMSMLVTDVENIGDYTYIRFDLDNRNDEDITMFDYQKFKLKTSEGRLLTPMAANFGSKASDTGVYNNIFLNSLDNNEKYDGVELIFSKLEVGSKFTLSMPLTRKKATLVGEPEEATLSFNLIVEDLEAKNK